MVARESPARQEIAVGVARDVRYNGVMSIATTLYHLRGQATEAIEQALAAIFAREDREPAPRVEGTYSAVLERATSPDVEATYRYLLLRPRPTGWTTLIELGLRAEGLDVELSQALGGAVIVAVFSVGGIVSGYRVVREGTEVDRYVSDPTAFEEPDRDAPALSADEIEALRGRPERFADLLPDGTTPGEFMRVVLAPGWWEERDAAGGMGGEEASEGGDTGDDEEELVDEEDRARCIGLALELWAADSYPLAGDLEDMPNNVAGPAIALGWR